MESVLALGFGQSAGQLDRAGEVDALTQLAHADAEGDRQVRLAHARRAEQHDVAALAAEPRRRQLVDEPPVDRRLGVVVEVLQPLAVREPGELQRQLDRSSAAFVQFAVEQVAEEVGVAPLVRRRLLGGLVEMVACRLEAQVFQAGGGPCFVGDAHHATSVAAAAAAAADVRG